MKTTFLSIFLGIGACVANAHVNDTITIDRPRSITIITNAERQVIDIQGKDGNPDYTYHSESALNGGSFVYANENRGWDFSLPEFQNREAVVWEKPVFDWTSARAWFYIDRVELTDTATTVYITHQVIPQYMYQFEKAEDIYLVTEKGIRYPLHSIEGTTLGQWHHKDYHDTEHYRFHFDPVPKDTRWVNFITEEEANGNCYNYFYLHDESQPIAHEEVAKYWQHSDYDEQEQLPQNTTKKPKTATLKIHFMNYQHSMFNSDMVTYNTEKAIAATPSPIHYPVDHTPELGNIANISSDRTVTIRADITEPTLLTFTMGNIQPGGICILLPGETTECLINLLSTPEGDEFTCEYKGRLALTNKQLTTFGLPLELRRYLKSQPDIHQRLLRLTPAARAVVTGETMFWSF